MKGIKNHWWGRKFDTDFLWFGVWTFYIVDARLTNSSLSYPCIQGENKTSNNQKHQFIFLSPHAYTIASLISFSLPFSIIYTQNTYLIWRPSVKTTLSLLGPVSLGVHPILKFEFEMLSCWMLSGNILSLTTWHYAFFKERKFSTTSFQASFWAVIPLCIRLFLKIPVISQPMYLKRS